MRRTSACRRRGCRGSRRHSFRLRRSRTVTRAGDGVSHSTTPAVEDDTPSHEARRPLPRPEHRAPLANVSTRVVRASDARPSTLAYAKRRARFARPGFVRPRRGRGDRGARGGSEQQRCWRASAPGGERGSTFGPSPRKEVNDDVEVLLENAANRVPSGIARTTTSVVAVTVAWALPAKKPNTPRTVSAPRWNVLPSARRHETSPSTMTRIDSTGALASLEDGACREMSWPRSRTPPKRAIRSGGRSPKSGTLRR